MDELSLRNRISLYRRLYARYTLILLAVPGTVLLIWRSGRVASIDDSVAELLVMTTFLIALLVSGFVLPNALHQTVNLKCPQCARLLGEQWVRNPDSFGYCKRCGFKFVDQDMM